MSGPGFSTRKTQLIFKVIRSNVTVTIDSFHHCSNFNTDFGSIIPTLKLKESTEEE